MNQQFGRYRIERELGRGAMGVVYQAFDTILEREVAIKTISSSIRDENLKERFLREARAAGKLLHPNIITVYDFGVEEDQLFISMEFVEGTDLLDLINSRPSLDIRKRLEIVCQICLGLDFAHAHGVFHRDVKPANVRLDNQGRVKIVDFGLAIIQTSSLTRSNAILGTPSYIAPERLLGGQSDARSDQFAVGIILFELLTYSKAFKGDNLSLVIHHILHNDPPRLDEQFLAQFPEVQIILSKAIDKNPMQRYPSMGDMARELDLVRNRMAHEGFLKSDALATADVSVDAELWAAETELTHSSPLKAAKSEQDVQTVAKGKGHWRLVMTLFLIISGVAAFLFVGKSNENVGLLGTLVFDVKPYAQVREIINRKYDTPVPLEGAVSARMTPLRLLLPTGRYQITYDHPDWGGVSRSVVVDVLPNQVSYADDRLGDSFLEQALAEHALPLDFISEED